MKPGNTGLGICCDDVLKVASQLKKKGVVFTEDVKKEDWGTYGMFKDLDGNEFWLLEGGP